METISLNRRTLYEKIWSDPLPNLSSQFDIWVEGLENICKRLNVPIPEKSHWRQISQGKKGNIVALPAESHGTETVVLYKRNDELQKLDHLKKIKDILLPLDQVGTGIKIDDKIFDKLILTTREGTPKHWEIRHDEYWEKNKMLDIHVSPERFSHALLIMDLLIKLLRFKKHDLIVEQRNTYAVVEGEKIQISLGEKNKRVEFMEDKRLVRDLHPTGCLFLRREGSYYKKEWKDGKVALEDQLLKIVNDLEQTSTEMKEERIRMKKAQEEREEQERIKRELEKRVETELTRFKMLLFEAHRFSVSTMLRAYIDQIEENAIANNSLNKETTEWIAWSRQKADWFDPSIPKMSDELLNGIDIENLRTKNSMYSGNYYNPGYEQTKDNFWKPWWSR
jgi:hypothetical protein